jgi:general secretion pathway protein K
MRVADQGEAGFALVAALGAAMLVALVAYTVLAADRAAIASLDAEQSRARLEAAADAGLALALQGLGASPSRRWPLDGRSRSFEVDGAAVSVLVEDERGKIALPDLSASRARSLFEAAGVRGPRLDQLVASVLNWQDGGDRAEGAKELDYVADSLRPRGEAMKTVGELMAVRGMDRDLFDRIAPALTVFSDDSTSFDPDTASPLARKVMDAAETVDLQETGETPPARKSELFSESGDDYVGRRLTVRITARDARGGLYRRAAVVELTGQPREPFWVRAVE